MNTKDAIEWMGARTNGNLPPSLGVVTNDTRTLPLGALYVALKGERFDGHAFVKSALDKGASAALVNASWSRPPELDSAPLLIVEDTYKALRDLARGWRESFVAAGTKVVGLTGSCGKTTTRAMTAAMLAGSGKPVAATVGNLNNHIGLPLSILSMKRDAAFGVFETGVNHPGEMAPLATTLQPDAVIVTNIGTAHIEFFKTQEGIAAEKGGLLEVLPETGFWVADADCACRDRLAARSAARGVMVSLHRPEADFCGRLVNVLDGTVEICERATGETTIVRSNLPGEHNAVDLLLAFATARLFGVPAEACAAAMEKFELPGLRWRVSEREGVTWVNDAYNANPQSMAASLKTFLSLPAAGRRMAVLGDMFELGEATERLHREIGLLVATSALDRVVFVGKAMTAFAACEARERGYSATKILTAATAAEAKELLRSVLRKGDRVLLKGSRGMGLEAVEL